MFYLSYIDDVCRRVSKATLAKKEQKETAAPEVEVKKETEIQVRVKRGGVHWKELGLCT